MVTRKDIQEMKELAAKLECEKLGHRIWPINVVFTKRELDIAHTAVAVEAQNLERILDEVDATGRGSGHDG